jgi:hypothetical protein
MLIWFVLFALPVLFFGLSLATEVSSMLIINRRVRLSAESAAVAGAFSFRQAGPDDMTVDGTLDEPQAQAIARATFDAARNAGAVKGAEIDFVAVSTSPTRVEVRVTYRFEDTPILDFLGANGVGQVSITEVAEVCIPGDASGPTGGACQRPDVNYR